VLLALDAERIVRARPDFRLSELVDESEDRVSDEQEAQLPDECGHNSSLLLRQFKSNRLEPPSIPANQASRHPFLLHALIQNPTTA